MARIKTVKVSKNYLEKNRTLNTHYQRVIEDGKEKTVIFQVKYYTGSHFIFERASA